MADGDQGDRARFVMRLAAEESRLAGELNVALAAAGGDVAAAFGDTDLRREWAEALPEVRAGMLMSAAWVSRRGVLPDRDQFDYGLAFDAYSYASDLYGYAVGFDGGAAASEEFHGQGFPALPLPGQAGALATSLGFDRDDLVVSLHTCLLLLHAAQAATTNGAGTGAGGEG